MVLNKIPRKSFPLSQKPSKIVYYLLINETVPSNAIKHNAPATQRPGTEEKQGFPTMQFFSPLSHKADLSRIRLTWLGRQRDHELIGLSFLSPPSPSKLLGLSFPERSQGQTFNVVRFNTSCFQQPFLLTTFPYSRFVKNHTYLAGETP